MTATTGAIEEETGKGITTEQVLFGVEATEAVVKEKEKAAMKNDAGVMIRGNRYTHGPVKDDTRNGGRIPRTFLVPQMSAF